MVKYSLVYFDFKGKGELIRLIFAAAKQQFQDKRFEYPNSKDWIAFKPLTPFERLPILEILNDDGSVSIRLGQSLAIGRYLANQFNLSGENDIEKAEADAYCDQINELSLKVIEYLSESDSDKLKQIRQNMDENVLPSNFKYFENKIRENKSGFLIGNSLTWTDLYLLSIIDWFDEDYKNEILQKYELIKANYNKVKSNPNVAEWISKRPVTKY